MPLRNGILATLFLSDAKMLKTIQLTERIYFDPNANMVILSIDRITLTLTLSEFFDLHKDMKLSAAAVTNFVTIATGLDKIMNYSLSHNSYINSSSNKG